jgi:acyl-coenzyme A thioesterase PaaI-like protein
VTAPAVSEPAGSDPRSRLAAALRPIIGLTVSGILDDHILDEAAAAVEAIGERLEAEAHPGKRTRHQPVLTDPPQEFFPTSPVVGVANPLAPPVRIWAVDPKDGGFREIAGEANFGYAYEGPPTCVHGGVIAETFDEILGAATMVSGNPGMTGTLTIKYRKPTPLGTDLRVVARCLNRSGRKVKCWGGIYDGDVLTAEAEGIFIQVGPAQILTIAESNADHADPAMLDAIRNEAARLDERAGSDEEQPDPLVF